MAKNTVDRKSLKEDAVQDSIFRLIDWVYRHRTLFITSALALASLAALAVSLQYMKTQSRLEENLAFHEAEKLLDAEGKDNLTRLNDSEDAFKKFIDSHGESPLAPAAMMQLARIAWDTEDVAKSERYLMKVLEHPETEATTRSLALSSLGTLSEFRGELDKAAEHYKSIQNDGFPQLKSYHLGRLAAEKSEPNEARKYFDEVVKDQPNSVIGQWAKQLLEYLP